MWLPWLLVSWSVLTGCVQATEDVATDCNSTLLDIYPEWDAAPYSCTGRCDELSPAVPCSCDQHCQIYGDCCHDMAALCLHVHSFTFHFSDIDVTAENNYEADSDDLSAGNEDVADSDWPAETEGVADSDWPAETEGVADSDWPAETEGVADSDWPAETEGVAESDWLAKNPVDFDDDVNADADAAADNDAGPQGVWPLAGEVGCRLGETRLISRCPTPLRLPAGPVLYGGRRIMGRELNTKCSMPWDDVAEPDVLLLLPVTDSVSGLHFLNVYCMLCHGVLPHHALPWTAGLVWGMRQASDQPVPFDLRQLLTTSAILRLPVVLTPPENVTARRCPHPAVLRSVSCPCLDLKQRCLSGPVAPVMGNYQLYRNPDCLLCAFLGAGVKPVVVRVPLETNLMFSFNSFHRPVTLAWATSPAFNPSPVLTVSYQQATFRPLWPWQQLRCFFNQSANQTVSLSRSMSDGSQGNENSQGSHGSGRNGERQGTEDRELCVQTECAPGLKMVNNQCRLGEEPQMFTVRISCKESEESPRKPNMAQTQGETMGPKNNWLQAGETTRRGLTGELLRRLHSHATGAMVSDLSIFWDVEYCFWNVSVSVLFPDAEKRAAPSTDTLATAMYAATTHALQTQLNNATSPLFVCVNVLPSAPGDEGEGNTCDLRTLFRPGVQRHEDGVGRASLSWRGPLFSLSILLCFLATVCCMRL